MTDAPQTNAQRVAKVAAAKIAAGLKQIRSLWAHPDDIPAIRAYAAKLAKKRAGIGVSTLVKACQRAGVVVPRGRRPKERQDGNV